MTGGKTRQKRNGPGGSGCFHAFCYFLVRRRRALRGGGRPARTWCTIPRKPLLFRRRAPRLWDQRRRRRAGRGASLPANPCSFVDGHHVFGAKGAAGEPDVVLHSPQTLALSSTGTTFLGPKALPASVPISISLQKERIDDGTSGQSVPSSISTDFNGNSWN